MEYAIKKSTTPLLKPIKQKHTQTLGDVTYSRDIHALFRTLGGKMHEPNWIVVFKTLLLIHILMREANVDGIMKELMDFPDLINADHFRDRSMNASSVAQSKNIKAYSKYLQGKVESYKELKYDFVRNKAEIISKFRMGTVDMAFMKLLEKLQIQISNLLGCSFYPEDLDNYVTLQCFRVLIGDMLSLFHILNEGVIKMLGEYFELPKAEAQRGLSIYKAFASQTSKTVTFFEHARRMGSALGIDVPVFKHAPISLAGALEEYVNAPDFDAQQESFQNKKAAKAKSKSTENLSPKPATNVNPSPKQQQPQVMVTPAPNPGSPVKGANILIDFFASTDEVQNQYGFNAPTFNTWAQPVGTINSANLQNMSISSNAGFAPSMAPSGSYSASSSTAVSPSSNPFAQQVPASSGFPNQFPVGFSAGTDPSFTVDNVFGNQVAFGSSAAPSLVSNPFNSSITASSGPAAFASTVSSNPFGSAPISPPATSKAGSNNPFGAPSQPPVISAIGSGAGGNNPFGQPAQVPFPPMNSSLSGSGFASQQTFAMQSQSMQNGFMSQPGGSMNQPFSSASSALGSPSTAPSMSLQSMPQGFHQPGSFMSQPQQSVAGFGSSQGFKSPSAIGPAPQVVDHLAGINPFAKPAVPLAAMSSQASAGLRSPMYGGNVGLPFSSSSNPAAGLAPSSVQKNNSNNPFFK